MTISLFEQHPKTCASLKLRGYVGIAEMAQNFHSFTEMSRALSGNDASFGSVVGRWIRGQTSPSWPSEEKARAWVSANIRKSEPTQQASLPLIAYPNPDAKPIQKADVVMMVICKPHDQAKVAKVLTFMNCEVVEI